MAAPAEVTAFAEGVIKDLGAPVNSATITAFETWLANEQGSDWSAFNNNKGNPLGIQTPQAQAAGKAGNMAEGIKLTAQELLTNPDYTDIVSTFKQGDNTTAMETAIMNSAWSGGEYAKKGLANFQAAPTGTTTGEPGAVNVPSQPAAQPIAGADIKDFYGYDLSPWAGSPDLGKMEQAIKQYVIDPGYKATIDQKLTTEYGYQTNWWKSIPEVNAVMIYAATSLDPSNATQQNEFQSLLAQTNWWKTTTSNGRYWDEAYGTNGQNGTDPAQAQQALQNAQEKVLADANQIGVTLSKQELDAIALTYAKNNYVASGSFGTASGTAAEWLDQAIIDTLENIQGQKIGKIPTDFSTLAAGQSQFGQDTSGNPTSTSTGTPTGLTGIAAELYSGFQNIAQQYLMYNPSNPSGSLLTQQSLLDQVEKSLQNYTGTGSSFGSSNLIAGAEAQFTQQMMTQAAQMYPSLAASIQAGVTPQAYVQPYQSAIGSMLDIDPASINFTTPQWNWVIATPSANGTKTALTLDQVQQKLATTPMFDQSNNAQQMADSVTKTLSQQFGFGGT
jgi:hypothetical protein